MKKGIFLLINHRFLMKSYYFFNDDSKIKKCIQFNRDKINYLKNK